VPRVKGEGEIFVVVEWGDENGEGNPTPRFGGD
jgi:hypothetical protein